MAPWLAAFIAFDVVVTAIVLIVVLRRRLGSAAGIDFDDLREFTEFTERTVETNLTSRWSGDAAALPAVLSALVAEIEADARSRQLPIGRPWIKQAVSRWIRSKRLVDAEQLREAMEQVA